MARYIQFTTADGSTILVEVDQAEVPSGQGVTKAGLRERIQDTVVAAQATYDEALKLAIHQNVVAFIRSVRALPDPPTDVEVTIGLKATGELSNIAVGKIGGDVNFTVKLTWKQLERLAAETAAT